LEIDFIFAKIDFQKQNKNSHQNQTTQQEEEEAIKISLSDSKNGHTSYHTNIKTQK